MTDHIPGLIVAPSEPVSYKQLSVVCLAEPESHGVDFLWDAGNAQLWGIQRKTPADLFASIADGRLQMELQQNSALTVSILLIDGEFRWHSSSLEWLDNRTKRPWTRHHFDRLVLSVQMRGWWVIRSEGPAHSIQIIRDTVEWSRKTDHSSMLSRPQQHSIWGTSSSTDWQCWMLQSIPGVGPNVAKAIVDRFRGLPVILTATRDDLLSISGIGPERADSIIKAFRHDIPRRRRKKSSRTT